MKNRLTYKNNWEADSYFVGDKEIVTLSKISVNGKEFKVTHATVSVPYNDMGHTYDGTSTHYFIKEKVFGIEKMFDLNTIVSKAKVYAIEFTVKEK